MSDDVPDIEKSKYLPSINFTWWEINGFLVMLLASGFAAYWSYRTQSMFVKLKFEDHIKAIATIRLTSSIAFGIAGTWISLLYGNMAKDIMKKENGHSPNAIRMYSEIGKLLHSLLANLAIVVVAVCMEISYPLMITLDWVQPYRPAFACFSAFALTSMFFFLAYSLIIISFPIWHLLTLVQAEAQRKAELNRRTDSGSRLVNYDT